MKKSLAIVLALVLVVGVSAVVFAQPPGGGPGDPPGGPPEFSADIEITSATGEFEVEEGQTLLLTATWSTNEQDVTDESWSVDGSVKQTDGIPEGEREAGVSTFVFDATELEPGDYQVCFHIWHHTQTHRDATECVTITVLPVDEECPAAPAIANAYLDSIGFTDGRGDIITAVTDQMGLRASFQGIEKCIDGEPNPAYQEAVIDFVDAYLAENYPDFEY